MRNYEADILLTRLGLGGGLLYLFDPDCGRRRRARIRGAAAHIINVTDDAIGKTAHDIHNRARGLITEVEKK